MNEGQLAKIDRPKQNWLKSRYFGQWMVTFDLVAAIVVVSAATWYLRKDPCPISDLLDKDGTALYGAFLSSLAALLGFAIAAVAIIASLVAGRTFDALRKSNKYENFWLAFKWSIRALALATFSSLVALFANEFEPTRDPILIIVVFCIICATASLVRSGYTLEVVLKQTKDADRKPVKTISTYDEVK
jgi:hypothetical protein